MQGKLLGKEAYIYIERIIMKFKSTKYLFIFFAFFGASLSYAQIQEEQVIQAGEGYALKSIRYIDPQGMERTSELYFIHNVDGAVNAYLEADLPLEELMDLEQEATGNPWTGGGFSASSGFNATTDDEQFGWVIDKTVVNLASEAEAQAYIDIMGLQDIVDEEELDPEGDFQTGSDFDQGFFFKNLFKKCKGWKSKSKSFNKNVNEDLNGSKTFGSSNASLTFTGNMDVNANVSVNMGYEYKRNFFCIPYKVRYKDVRAQGSYDVDGNFKISGQAKHNFGDQSWKIAEPKVVDTVFFAGPVPVRFALKIPISIGTGDIVIKAEGQVTLTKDANINGNFHYYCNRSACNNIASNHSNNFNDLLNNVGASVSASLTLQPYVHVAAKPILYWEWFFYAQVGVKPSFPIEVFGYYGNLCGDGDDNGSNEWVNALLGTLGIEVEITGEAKLFGGYVLKPKTWNVYEDDLFMMDFINPSTAFSPIIRPEVQDNMLVTMPINVRSCVSRFANSYPETYTVNWGDGSTQTISNVKSLGNSSHNYTQPGDYLVTVSSKRGATTSFPLTIASDDPWTGGGF